MNAAALSKDPVERMKLMMTSSLAWIYCTHHFEKPLDPILGETYEAEMPDGSKIYCE
jgi:hypothetical protein